MNTNEIRNPGYLENGCSRADALRTGQLHDISKVQSALNARFTVPTAMSPTLWQAVAGEIPFTLDHPQLLLLCRLVVARVATDQVERKHQGLFSETAWVRVPLAGRPGLVKVICHPGDTAAPVMTLLHGDEATQLEI